MKFGFVVLHYKVIAETKQCVESILKSQHSQDFCVVIVDNGSGNGTGEQLKAYFSNESKVHTILSSENLGFARGNNLGFVYAKEKEHCDFICLINNDTLVNQPDFISRVYDDYEKNHFAALGPKIILKDGSVNPMMGKLPSIRKLTIHRQEIKAQLVLCRFIPGFFGMVDGLKNLYDRIRKAGKKADTTMHPELEFHSDVMLHGCCLIFSPLYIDKFDGLDDRTFLYREEQLLYIRLLKNDLKSCYDPELWIIHLEDAATNAATATPYAKRVFTLQNEVRSMGILLDELRAFYAEK